jgi:hypothetical protein
MVIQFHSQILKKIPGLYHPLFKDFSRTIPVFQDFPGPGKNRKKFQDFKGISRTRGNPDTETIPSGNPCTTNQQ